MTWSSCCHLTQQLPALERVSAATHAPCRAPLQTEPFLPPERPGSSSGSRRPLTSGAFINNCCHKVRATISVELISPGSPSLVALSSSSKGEASLSQRFLSTNNPRPCRGGWQAMPRGPRCDRSWLRVHTALAPRSMGKRVGGGIIFVVLPRVFVRKNKTHVRRRETAAQHSTVTCQDAAIPPGVHTMHTGAGSGAS